MKKTFSLIAILALGAGLSLAGCSSENDEETPATGGAGGEAGGTGGAGTGGASTGGSAAGGEGGGGAGGADN